MKKIVVAALVLLSLSVQAQTRKPASKTTGTRTTAGTTGSLKNITDSASYALGLSVANFYKQQGFKNLNTTLIAKAINDVQAGRKVLFTEEQANETIMFFVNPTLRTTISEGSRFLATNSKKSGIKTTASGLQYEVLKDAQGARPKATTDTVLVNYAGTLLNGTEFDNSYKRGQPVEFALGRVIKGWTEGLQLMPVGSKYKFYVPYNLGYGLNGNGPIPGGATLVFEVELLNVKPTK